MARKRITITPVISAEIDARILRGESCTAIAAALGGGLSASTVARRIREKRGAAQSSRQKVPPVGEPSTDEETIGEGVPDGADAAIAERWLQRVERSAIAAQAAGNLAALGTMGRLVATFLEHKRKATPIKPPDPNEDPDMFAARERARNRFHELISKALKP